ncbi:MAG: hypothetical protein ACRD5M_09960 [Candidatus Acidiferrales bacterium]
MGGILAKNRARDSCRPGSRLATFGPVILSVAITLFSAGCKHVQPLDTKPLDAAGMSYDTIKKLESLQITAPEIAQMVKAKNAGFSDQSCIDIFQISHGRGEAFTSGDAIAGLIRVGMREPSILELARLNQMGIEVGQLQAIRLTGLSDSIVLEVARHHAAGKPELSGVSLARLKNAGLRESTLLELARRGIPDSQAAAIIAYRHHGASDAEILRHFSGS